MICGVRALFSDCLHDAEKWGVNLHGPRKDDKKCRIFAPFLPEPLPPGNRLRPRMTATSIKVKGKGGPYSITERRVPELQMT